MEAGLASDGARSAPSPTLSGIAAASGQDFAQSGEQDKAAFYARQQPKDREAFLRWLDYAKQAGAIGTGPSATRIHLGEQRYSDQ